MSACTRFLSIRQDLVNGDDHTIAHSEHDLRLTEPTVRTIQTTDGARLMTGSQFIRTTDTYKTAVNHRSNRNFQCKKKNLTSVEKGCKPPAHSPCTSLFNHLWFHCPAVDADVVDQAGEVGSGRHSFAGADVQAV